MVQVERAFYGNAFFVQGNPGVAFHASGPGFDHEFVDALPMRCGFAVAEMRRAAGIACEIDAIQMFEGGDIHRAPQGAYVLLVQAAFPNGQFVVQRVRQAQQRSFDGQRGSVSFEINAVHDQGFDRPPDACSQRNGFERGQPRKRPPHFVEIDCAAIHADLQRGGRRRAGKRVCGGYRTVQM